ncbi:unnamed protein product [Amoebophrya sp. A120]|nr:unnamed protein product [Amoebophrya sp. A120]|eukprot:GSA120T00021125001.1
MTSMLRAPEIYDTELCMSLPTKFRNQGPAKMADNVGMRGAELLACLNFGPTSWAMRRALSARVNNMMKVKQRLDQGIPVVVHHCISNCPVQICHYDNGVVSYTDLAAVAPMPKSDTEVAKELNTLLPTEADQKHTIEKVLIPASTFRYPPMWKDCHFHAMLLTDCDFYTSAIDLNACDETGEVQFDLKDATLYSALDITALAYESLMPDEKLWWVNHMSYETSRFTMREFEKLSYDEQAQLFKDVCLSEHNWVMWYHLAEERLRKKKGFAYKSIDEIEEELDGNKRQKNDDGEAKVDRKDRNEAGGRHPARYIAFVMHKNKNKNLCEIRCFRCNRTNTEKLKLSWCDDHKAKNVAQTITCMWTIGGCPKKITEQFFNKINEELSVPIEELTIKVVKMPVLSNVM